MPKVAAVVVTYNRKELLLENISALLNQKPFVPDIVVVDNFSTDGTKEMLQCHIDSGNVIYYNTGANLGGAGGFHYGIRKAAELKYDFIWIMDDDCIPHEDALAEFLLADEMLAGKYGFLSSKVLWTDGSICTMNVQRRTMTQNIANFSGNVIPVVMASFVSLFVKRDVVMELGLPIKDFFIWTDDWEFTRRISRKYTSYVVPKSVVTHKSKMNIGANIATDSIDRIDRYKYLYRNDVVLYRREGLTGFLYEIVRLVSHAVRVLRKASDNKLRRIGMIVKGTCVGLIFFPEIEFVKEQNL